MKYSGSISLPQIHRLYYINVNLTTYNFVIPEKYVLIFQKDIFYPVSYNGITDILILFEIYGLKFRNDGRIFLSLRLFNIELTLYYYHFFLMLLRYFILSKFIFNRSNIYYPNKTLPNLWWITIHFPIN